MALERSAVVSVRPLPDAASLPAEVLSVDQETVSLRLAGPAPPIPAGTIVIITEQQGDAEHYAEVLKHAGDDLVLRRIWTGKRDFFRVDDAFPVSVRKIDDAICPGKSRVLAAFSLSHEEIEPPDDTVSPRVWKMLMTINAKLNAVLDRLQMDSEGLAAAAERRVNVSASGIRFAGTERLAVGDRVQLGMLLPLAPSVAVHVTGTVVRTDRMGSGYVTAVQFTDMDDDVRDTIIQYTLKRQRELIRQQRGA